MSQPSRPVCAIRIIVGYTQAGGLLFPLCGWGQLNPMSCTTAEKRYISVTNNYPQASPFIRC